MAFLATLRATYSNATSRAAQLKKLAQDTRDLLAAGPVSANVIRQLLETCIAVKAENVATAAVPGIANQAKAQEGDALYDVAAAWSAMNNAIDAVRVQILSDVPTGAGGYRLTETWTASGVAVRTFTSAQTAALRTALDNLIATIN